MGCHSGGAGRNSTKGERAGTSDAPALNTELVRRANEAGTFVDYGDATSRQYQKNVDEIKNMDMTADERKTAYS